MAIAIMAAPASAISYNNATIADLALGHVGETYGECWTFVRDMIYKASDGTQDISAQSGNYFDHLSSAGGTEITSSDNLTKGDIVQEGMNGGHTYIIVGPVSGSIFDVVDSNHDYAGTVMHYHRNVSLDSDDKAYRFGDIDGPSNKSGWGGLKGFNYFGSYRLTAGQQLRTGQYLLSNNAQFALVLQSDGNLVLYENGTALWASRTSGSGANHLAMQDDGNLVLYAGGTPKWHSGTDGTSSFVVQDDGNLVVYRASNGLPTWDSKTGGHKTYTGYGSYRLTGGSVLNAGYYIRSSDKRYALLVKYDGNLVLYGPGYHVLWASNTAGTGANRAAMQIDGNFVVYAANTPKWSSKTNGISADLVVQDDGNLVIYNGGTPIWSSGTGGQV
jgi:hypothetical protein